MGSLRSHRFASSIDGSLAPCFNSTLFRDIMASAWVQENARWDGFSSSQFSQLNSPIRNTLEIAFSFSKLPLKFSDQRRKSKMHVLGKNRNRCRNPHGPVGPSWPAHPTPQAGPVLFSMYHLYFTFLARDKKLAQ
jgi:hypothetical protein